MDAWGRRRGQFIDDACSIPDLLYRLKPKGDTSIDVIGQIYLEWVRYRRERVRRALTDEF